MSILTWLVIGLIAGCLSTVFARSGGFGIIGDILIGLVGAMLGGFVAAEILNLYDALSGFDAATIIAAVLGSIITIWILRLTARPVQNV